MLKRVCMLTAKKYYLLFMFTCILSCASSGKQDSGMEEIGITKLQSYDDFSSYIQINTFSYESKEQELPAYYRINGILFQNSDFKKYFIVPVKKGFYQIEAGFIGKEEVALNALEVGKGDSVLVKFYLKDDPEPLHE